MSDYDGVNRLKAVITASERLSAASPGLVINGASDGAQSTDSATCVVRLRHDSGPDVLLTVETTKAGLTAHSGQATSHAGTAVITDHLEISLISGYCWDDAECADACA